MQTPNNPPGRLVREMRKVFFDLDRDAALVYLDPAIGRLQSARHHALVRFRRQTLELELVVHGRVETAFALAGGVEEACRQAFVAYFRAIERLCRPAAVAA